MAKHRTHSPPSPMQGGRQGGVSPNSQEASTAEGQLAADFYNSIGPSRLSFDGRSPATAMIEMIMRSHDFPGPRRPSVRCRRTSDWT